MDKSSQDPPSSGAAFPVVAIGASAGGLEAFSELLRYLPANTGMAFVFIQHLAPSHASMLASILAKSTSMPVVEVESGMAVKPDHVYVIPPNTCMTISTGVLKLVPRSARQSDVNLPIDVFLRSLAEDRGNRAIGIVLSGTASDGSAGITAIKEEGGITFAQDEKSAKFEQMPQNAVATDCIDFVLSPEKIAQSLGEISRHPYANPSENQIRQLLPEKDEPFRQILLLLKKASGVDFACYKPQTLKRRIIRRMVLARKETLQDYLDLLKSNPSELEALHQDVLIKVTRFFRDPEIFKTVQEEIYPHIVKNKSHERPLRIWVPACSTGEEVYSLAIALLEYLGAEANSTPIQFFGSDIKEKCIQTARTGIYPESIVREVSPERLNRFFNKVDQGYQITKLIREFCIFAKHNATADPPFSKVDLISCRNFLIYLTPALQKTVISTFHYALSRDGFLLLGSSESIMNFQHLFKCVHQKARIYSKKQTQNTRTYDYVASPYAPEKLPRPKKPDRNEESRMTLHVQREADRVVMRKYEQAGVVINEAMEILQFRGDTSHYLKPAPGTPSLNLLKMVREGLLTELRVALSQVRKDGTAFKKERIRMKYNGDFKKVSVEVIPLKVPRVNQRHFLILFAQSTPKAPDSAAEKPASEVKLKPGSPKEELEKELLSVKDELLSTKAYMQSIIEEREHTNAELQAANEEVVTSNEELQSLNEEMQSTNEELETAKEELQSSNEEITTVNDELNSRNLQLTQLNDDFVNLINSIQLPVIIVGNNLQIRRFTPAAKKAFSLVETDTGRPLSDIKVKIKVSNLEELISQVLKDHAIQEQEAQDEKGNWYNLQIRPYQTSNDGIDGVVITFVDISFLKVNQRLMEEQNHYLNAVIQTVPTPLLVLDPELRVRQANEAFYRMFQVEPDQAEKHLIYDLGNKQWDIPELRDLLEKILPEKKSFTHYEVQHDFENIGLKCMLLNARQIDHVPIILLAIDDITERKQHEENLQGLNTALKKQSSKLQQSNVELERFASVAAHDLQQPFNIISMFTDLLAENYQGALEPKAQEFITIVKDAAGKAQDLIRGLLDYGRIESEEEALETVDTQAAVKQVLSDLRREVEESSMDIRLGALPKVVGSRLHLTRLFQNLISNAMKYRSKRPLKVFISARKENAAWIFEVSDNGKGFDAKYKDKIFELFKRLEGGEVPGSGIGLAACKKIVERHGGKIWAESEPGKGSSFYFSLPGT